MKSNAFSPLRTLSQFFSEIGVKYLHLTPKDVARAIVSYLCDIPIKEVVVGGGVNRKSYWSDKIHGTVTATYSNQQTTVDLECGSYKLKPNVKFDSVIVQRISSVSPVVQLDCEFFSDVADGCYRESHEDSALIYIDTLDYATKIGLNKRLPFGVIDYTLPQNPLVQFYNCPVHRVWQVLKKPHNRRMNALVEMVMWFCAELRNGFLACGFESDSLREECWKSMHEDEEIGSSE